MTEHPERRDRTGLRAKLAALARGLDDFYSGPYRGAFAQAQREEDDLFLLLVMCDSLGIDNPAALFTLELLPVVYEDAHAWHTRLGMERSPLEQLRCC